MYLSGEAKVSAKQDKLTVWLLYWNTGCSLDWNTEIFHPPVLVHSKEELAYETMAKLIAEPLQNLYYTNRKSYHKINKLLIAGDLHDLPRAWSDITCGVETFRVEEVEVIVGTSNEQT